MDRGNPFSPDARLSPKAREAALRAQSFRQSWPLLVLIPLLLGILYACAWSLLIQLFLGESFGLSGGRPAPWPGALTGIFLVAFWVNRWLARARIPSMMAQVITFAGWFVTYVGWVLLEPAYRETEVWSNPGEFVKSEGYLIPPLLISMVVWWVGVAYAGSIANVSAEDNRLVVQRAWVLLFLSILLAALVNGEAGDQALGEARWVEPIQLVTSMALVAGAEVESTRRLAAERGAQGPGWGRWLRLVGGLAAGVLILTVIVLLAFNPNTLDAMVGAIVQILRWAGFVLAYVLYAIVWTLFQIFNWVASLFGGMFGPVNMPSPPIMNRPPETQQEMQDSETGPWKYAILLRWGLLGLVVLVLAILFFRLTRRPTIDEESDLFDEQRESVFSSDLARQQLRDLFRRRHRGDKPRRLDLTRPPGSVREMMVYLETLAARQRAARREYETADDFAARLRAVWPGLGQPLIGTSRRYEAVRYGELPDPPDEVTLNRVREDWEVIWSRRKDWVPPPEEEPEAKAED
jgi:hypothetical protein